MMIKKFLLLLYCLKPTEWYQVYDSIVAFYHHHLLYLLHITANILNTPGTRGGKEELWRDVVDKSLTISSLYTGRKISLNFLFVYYKQQLAGLQYIHPMPLEVH